MRRVKTLIYMLGICFVLFMNNTMLVCAETADATAQDAGANYEIYVNTALNCVTVMQYNAEGNLVPVKAMVCSCAKEGKVTPKGTFKTSDYYDWRMMVDGTYGRYAVRFNNKILFHSVPYVTTSPGALEWDQYNLLGQGASLGCVRLSVEDAKWIYDNCKPGTVVVVYADAENPGPLGKPESIKIDENSPYRGWDPTDLDPNNPWHNPQIAKQYPIGSIDQFDHIRYADKYADVKAAYGYDKNALYSHYINCGIFEGRIAEFNAG